MTDVPARRHRRAVGPPGAAPAVDEPLVQPVERPASEEELRKDEQRLRADMPPHHDQGV